MMRRAIWSVCCVLILASAGMAQQKFRSGIFLHHSTGQMIWGPHGSTTSVLQEIAKYNTAHALTGPDVISMTELWWPGDPLDNEWDRWHRILFNMDTTISDLRPLISANKIVMIKSCFPSSDLWGGVGLRSDTTNWTTKSVMNYKWHWRKFIARMREMPSNFFVVWTNAPLINTTDQRAALADWFCRWAKDTLAAGLDTEFGTFPKNVYVFDFFHKLAGADGKLPLQYAASSIDSHPNSAATELVAPQLVQEVFNAAIQYETYLTAVEIPSALPTDASLGQNYPNPFNPTTTIPFTIRTAGHVRLQVFNIIGQPVATLVDGELAPGVYAIPWNAAGHASGPYFYRLEAPGIAGSRHTALVR